MAYIRKYKVGFPIEIEFCVRDYKESVIAKDTIVSWSQTNAVKILRNIRKSWNSDENHVSVNITKYSA